MGDTFCNILLHIVFSTKERRPLITVEIQSPLYGYMAGIVKGEGGALLAIGGMPGYIHLLVAWRIDANIAALVRDLKANSSRWVHQSFRGFEDFGWQKGYGVFSVSQTHAEQVKGYIRHQEYHHRQLNSREELEDFLKRQGIEYDPQYL